MAALVGLWVSVYLRLARRLYLRQLLVNSLLFFAFNCLDLLVIAHNYRPAWLTPVIYVWVGMFGVVAPAQVWTLANGVLTTREAKRMYGFIGSGATAGWIVGGFLTQVYRRERSAPSSRSSGWPCALVVAARHGRTGSGSGGPSSIARSRRHGPVRRRQAGSAQA